MCQYAFGCKWQQNWSLSLWNSTNLHTAKHLRIKLLALCPTCWADKDEWVVTLLALTPRRYTYHREFVHGLCHYILLFFSSISLSFIKISLSDRVAVFSFAADIFFYKKKTRLYIKKLRSLPKKKKKSSFVKYDSTIYTVNEVNVGWNNWSISEGDLFIYLFVCLTLKPKVLSRKGKVIWFLTDSHITGNKPWSNIGNDLSSAQCLPSISIWFSSYIKENEKVWTYYLWYQVSKFYSGKINIEHH